MYPICSRIRFSIIAITIASAAAGVSSSAARAQVLEPGARVRVTELNGVRRTAAFESIDADSIRVATPGGTVAIPLSRLAALDISAGRERRFAQNMVFVAGAFAMAGGFALAAGYDPCDDCLIGPESRGEAFRWGALAGGLVGVPAGIIAGTVIRHDRWAPLYRQGGRPLRVALRPSPGRGVGFTATVRLE